MNKSEFAGNAQKRRKSSNAKSLRFTTEVKQQYRAHIHFQRNNSIRKISPELKTNTNKFIVRVPCEIRQAKTLPFVEIEEISSFDIRKMGIEETVIENEILSTLHRKIEELNLAERNMYLSKVLKVRGKRKEFTSFYRKRNKIVKKINMEIKEELKKFYEKEE